MNFGFKAPYLDAGAAVAVCKSPNGFLHCFAPNQTLTCFVATQQYNCNGQMASIYATEQLTVTGKVDLDVGLTEGSLHTVVPLYVSSQVYLSCSPCPSQMQSISTIF